MMRVRFILLVALALGCGEPADPDAGTPNDAGEDGGAPPGDAGGPDSGDLDAGTDAGPLVCDDGFADCDAVPTDCEVELTSDPLHCGACDMACPVPTGAVATCEESTCGFVCDRGALDCDGLPDTGCEVDPMTDAAHCGACDLACGTGQTCMAGACVGPRRVFVTSGTVVPSMLGDLATADAFCQSSARAVGFAGDYRAWLSAGTESPSTRFARSAMGYVRVDGASVATDWADLTDGSLGASPSIDETGAMAPLDCDVLTATWVTGAGRFDAACSNLMGTGRRGGMFGLPGRTDNQYTQGCLATIACNRPARLYCFEQ